MVATLIPAYTLIASGSGGLGLGLGSTQGYCGDPQGIGWTGHLLQTAWIFGFTDLVEYGYHWMGHRCVCVFHFHASQLRCVATAGRDLALVTSH